MGRHSAGIFQTLRDAALIQQTGGGNGFSFSRLRPKGALVQTSAGQATGPVGFLRVYDHAFGEIAQGGHRVGVSVAHSSYLMEEMPMMLERLFNVNVHRMQKPNDKSVTFVMDNRAIKDFLLMNGLGKQTSRNVSVPRLIRQSPANIVRTRRGANMARAACGSPGCGRFHHLQDRMRTRSRTFNISVGITDAFMQAVRDDKEWALRFPDLEEMKQKGFSGTLEQAEAAGIKIHTYKNSQCARVVQ
jgi:ribonucleotide reductase alpha subunit